MMSPFADLHCHTIYSDGTSRPDEIAQMAREKGFKGLSITDHDTLEAYRHLGDTGDLEILTGVEFSCNHKGASIHILGYAFDLEAPPILELVERHKSRREVRNLAILSLLESHGMPLSLEEVIPFSSHVVGRPHIALAMMKKGYVKSVQEAFQKYIGEKSPCYAGSKSVTVDETIDIIQASGGKAVIAHPHLIDSQKTLQELLEMPFDGIECYYAQFPPSKNKRWIEIAAKKGWLETGGSDYHGHIKPTLPYGASYVDETRFRSLLRKAQHSF